MPSKTGRRAKKEKRAKAVKRKSSHAAAPSTWGRPHNTHLPSRAATWSALSTFAKCDARFLIAMVVATGMFAVMLAHQRPALPFLPHLPPAVVGRLPLLLLLQCALAFAALLALACLFSSASTSTPKPIDGAGRPEAKSHVPETSDTSEQPSINHQEQTYDAARSSQDIGSRALLEDNLKEGAWPDADNDNWDETWAEDHNYYEDQDTSRSESQSDNDMSPKSEHSQARPPWQ